MSRLALIHRDLSSRITSLKQIVENSRVENTPPNNSDFWDKSTIDLNPNSNQLTIKSTKTRRKTNLQSSVIGKLQGQRCQSQNVLNQNLDEGFESDVDTISLVSTESAISLLAKNQETDSANGSASSDSDDSDNKQTNPNLNSNSPSNLNSNPELSTETVIEHVNLVNCICYKDEGYEDILILVTKEETLIFQFENPKELDTFHENFCTVKAVSNQRTFPQRHFNLLQRTDSDGMTHIRISRPENDNEFTSLISLPNISEDAHKFSQSQTVQRRRQISHLKKSKSNEDLLDNDNDNEEKFEDKLFSNNSCGLRKVWNSVEDILSNSNEKQMKIKPKVPPRRKKGPAPLPPLINPEKENLRKVHHINKSFSSPNVTNTVDCPNLGNIFQGQFVRVQVDQPKSLGYQQILKTSKSLSLCPEIIRYELSPLESHSYSKTLKSPKIRHFEAFKFSDPKNLTGYQILQDQDRRFSSPHPQQNLTLSKTKTFPSLKLYIPKYKSKKIQNGIPGCSPIQNSGSFTNRLFGMSAKLKEFSSLQSQCNPDKKYNDRGGHDRGNCQGQSFDNDVKSYNFDGMRNPYYYHNQDSGRFSLGRFGRLGRSGSLGNLTVLNQAEKGIGHHECSNTLKSVIKKKTREEDDRGRKTARGGNGKKVTFSAYNTVQVV